MATAYNSDTGEPLLEIKSLEPGFRRTLSKGQAGAYDHAMEALASAFVNGQHVERQSSLKGPAEVDMTALALWLVKGIAVHLASDGHGRRRR